MTSRERVLAALRREEVDHVPCSPTFNPLTELQRAGHVYGFPWPPGDVKAELEHCVRALGIDPVVRCGGGAYFPADGVTARSWRDGDLLRKVWTTPAGELHASVRPDAIWPHGDDIPFWSDFNIGHFVEPWLATEQDLDRLRHVLLPPDRAQDVERTRTTYRRARELAGRWDLASMASIGSGLTGAHQFCGSEPLCLMVMDHPALIDAYLELEHGLNVRHVALAAEAGIDIVRRNGFYETCDFFGPTMLGRFLGRRLRGEIDAAHAAGMLTAYTVHTGVMPMLDHLRRLGFDCLLHIDIAFEGVDLAAIRDSQERAKSFWIGPSGTYHMWSDDPGDVRRAVREVFDVLGRRGLLLTPCPSAHSIMPWANTLALIDEWKQLRSP